jgi:hypothetical protein
MKVHPPQGGLRGLTRALALYTSHIKCAEGTPKHILPVAILTLWDILFSLLLHGNGVQFG